MSAENITPENRAEVKSAGSFSTQHTAYTPRAEILREFTRTALEFALAFNVPPLTGPAVEAGLLVHGKEALGDFLRIAPWIAHIEAPAAHVEHSSLPSTSAELAALRKFYAVSTAAGVNLYGAHKSDCPFWFDKICTCGGVEAQQRIDAARAGVEAIISTPAKLNVEPRPELSTPPVPGCCGSCKASTIRVGPVRLWCRTHETQVDAAETCPHFVQEVYRTATVIPR